MNALTFIGGLILGLAIGGVVGIYFGAAAMYAGAKVLGAISKALGRE